ncbi:MAG TPA: acyl-CoA dehydrogenase family protein [Solirubrobacteraceae bacterium]|nr:acyl-CoA dehydrogenase family protein [Solirubrobacteraceae bacterium]
MNVAEHDDRIGDDERRQIAELAFSLGARYADRSFSDRDAARAQWDELSRAGLAALSLPPEHGGVGGMADLCLVVERLSAGGFPAGKLTISTAVAGSIIARNASDAQRKAWLPGIADGSLRFCFAITEPGAGSNSANLATRARRDGDLWRIAGQKTYISAVDDSDVMLLVARDADSGGLSLFAVPLPCDALDLQRVTTMVPTPEHQWTVFLDDLPIGADALIGEPGRGGRALFDGLNPERLVVAAQAVGIGRWCLQQAIAHARERVVFDAPIGRHQAVQHPLAEAYIELEAAWALVECGAHAYDADDAAGVASNVAKVKACDAGLQAADSALQCFGGSGFTGETMLFDRFSYLRLLRTVPVARELALNHVATAGLGLPRPY